MNGAQVFSRRVVMSIGRVGFAAAVLLVSGRLALAAVGWWIDFSDEPVRSDIIVALAGSYGRPPCAADLFLQGYAPEIWISRPLRPSVAARLARFGFYLPEEEAVDLAILEKKGVAAERVRFYGRGVQSTVDEALSLGREFPTRGKKILVVTSRFHARRARLIFRRALRGAEIRVVATPYEDFRRDWWRDRELAQQAVLETLKTAFYLGGGRFLSRP